MSYVSIYTYFLKSKNNSTIECNYNTRKINMKNKNKTLYTISDIVQERGRELMRIGKIRWDSKYGGYKVNPDYKSLNDKKK